MSAAFLALIDVIAIAGAVLAGAWILTLAIDALLCLASRLLVLLACVDYAKRHAWARSSINRWLERRG